MDGTWGRLHIEEQVNAYYSGGKYFENDIVTKHFKEYFGLL